MVDVSNEVQVHYQSSIQSTWHVSHWSFFPKDCGTPCEGSRSPVPAPKPGIACKSGSMSSVSSNKDSEGKNDDGKSEDSPTNRHRVKQLACHWRRCV